MPKYEIKDTIYGKQISRTDEDGTVWTFAENPTNSDYQAYLKYLEDNEE